MISTLDLSSASVYDEAFRKVVREMRDKKVGDTPAIWYVYNMGVIVKTRQSLFSIDLCHRLAPTIADELDFAIISHNHLDHYTREFYRAMSALDSHILVNTFSSEHSLSIILVREIASQDCLSSANSKAILLRA